MPASSTVRADAGLRRATHADRNDVDLVDQRARRALLIGAAGAPIFIVSSSVQAVTRSGFDLHRLPPSSLALGDLGWLQGATFVLSGACFLVGSFGLRRAMRGFGSRWAPRCIATFAVALIAAGIFPMDPAFGFPAGAPAGTSNTVSWHAVIHGIVFPVGFGAIVVTCVIIAIRSRRQHRRAAAWIAALVGPTTVVLSSIPNAGTGTDRPFLALWLAVVVAFGWLAGTLAWFASPRPQATSIGSA